MFQLNDKIEVKRMEKIRSFKKCNVAYINIRKKGVLKIEWLKNKGQNENDIITRRNTQICNHTAFKCIIVRL